MFTNSFHTIPKANPMFQTQIENSTKQQLGLSPEWDTRMIFRLQATFPLEDVYKSLKSFWQIYGIAVICIFY